MFALPESFLFTDDRVCSLLAAVDFPYFLTFTYAYMLIYCSSQQDINICRTHVVLICRPAPQCREPEKSGKLKHATRIFGALVERRLLRLFRIKYKSFRFAHMDYEYLYALFLCERWTCQVFSPYRI